MPYRGPDPQRIRQQVRDHVLPHAGQAVTWRQYVSASANVAAAGFDATPYYRDSTITALLSRGGFGQSLPFVAQEPGAAGSFAAGAFFVLTQQPLGPRDELVWNGEVYRVESESVPSRIASGWVSQVRRGG